jgi:pimeloyl-ACP methyl ester carboxylesterase
MLPTRRSPAASSRPVRSGLNSALILTAALLLAPLLLNAGYVAPAALAQGGTPTAASGDFAGLVDIGDGRRMYLECRGSGAPTVILEAGYRSPATVWSEDLVSPDQPRTTVLEGVSTFTRVCLYERPGVAAVLDGELVPSRSDPVTMPRPVTDIVHDLHALLQAAEVPGPYVLVGHSLGGLMVRLYQATYPEEVTGMVLVDAFPEQLRQHLTPEQWAAFLALNTAPVPQMAGYGDYETIDFETAVNTMTEAAAASPLPPMPLFVLARGKPLGLTEAQLGFSPETFEAAWHASQEDLAALSPLARFMVATESAHYIQMDEPELVIRAIARVVTATREPNGFRPGATPGP